MPESQGAQQDYRPDEERESIWSIARRLRNWYAWIFSVEYLIFLGLTIWDEVYYQTGDNALQTVLAVRRGMTANILDIVASAYVILEGRNVGAMAEGKGSAEGTGGGKGSAKGHRA